MHGASQFVADQFLAHFDVLVGDFMQFLQPVLLLQQLVVGTVGRVMVVAVGLVAELLLQQLALLHVHNRTALQDVHQDQLPQRRKWDFLCLPDGGKLLLVEVLVGLKGLVGQHVDEGGLQFVGEGLVVLDPHSQFGLHPRSVTIINDKGVQQLASQQLSRCPHYTPMHEQRARKQEAIRVTAIGRPRARGRSPRIWAT